jgi:D-xylose transport system substrate-binding protein
MENGCTAFEPYRAQERGISFEVKSAEGDENVQLEQATEFLNQGCRCVDSCCSQPKYFGWNCAASAHDYNVPVIAYDRLILNSELDYLVSFEYDKVGNIDG